MWQCRLVNFDTDFSDGLALYSLLAGYWPAYASKKNALHTATVLTPPDRHDNAELVVRLLAVGARIARCGKGWCACQWRVRESCGVT